MAFRPCWWKTFRPKRGERKRERKEKKEEGKKEKKEEEIEDRRHWEIVNICQLRINTCIMQKTNPASQRALLICDFLDLLGAAQALLLDDLVHGNKLPKRRVTS